MKRICISSAANRRNPDMLIDLIRAYLILRQMQRKRDVVKGMPVIYADLSDEEYFRSRISGSDGA
ncbi:MAG TPA: hypothetical protein VN372_07200 [Methanospirillum sp.]|nr:hypothetical protein [Methanospirillum sp.]